MSSVTTRMISQVHQSALCLKYDRSRFVLSCFLLVRLLMGVTTIGILSACNWNPTPPPPPPSGPAAVNAQTSWSSGGATSCTGVLVWTATPGALDANSPGSNTAETKKTTGADLQGSNCIAKSSFSNLKAGSWTISVQAGIASGIRQVNLSQGITAFVDLTPQ